jgi:phage terminase large subunit GpA-like protein
MAEDFMRVRKNPMKLKTFINTSLGELYQVEQEQYAWRNLYARREHYAAEAPQGVCYITIGADLQGDRGEFEYVGWGLGEESWSLGYVRLYGNVHEQPFWDILAEMFRKRFTREDGLILDVGLIGFDQQYLSDYVKAFSIKHGIRKIIPLVGMGKPGLPIATFPRTKTQEGVYRSTVGTDTAKTLIYGRYDILEPGPGYCHWPIADAYDEEFFKQATAEVRVKKYKAGNSYFVWDNPKDKRNEPLDCRQNALAALRIGQQNFGINLEALARQRSEAIKPQAASDDSWLGKIDEDNWIR